MLAILTCHLRHSILGLLTPRLVFSKTDKVKVPLWDGPFFRLLRAVMYGQQVLRTAVTSFPLPAWQLGKSSSPQQAPAEMRSYGRAFGL